MSKQVSMLRTNPQLGKRERLTVDGTVAGVQFDATKYTRAQSEKVEARMADAAILQVLTDEIYWTIDGTAPSSTVGFESAPGDFIYLVTQQQIKSFKAIRKNATNAAIEALFLFS
jgi:hypothetical protein